MKKMSEIMVEMMTSVLADPAAIPTGEAGHAALLLSQLAWNQSLRPSMATGNYKRRLRSFVKHRFSRRTPAPPGEAGRRA